MTSPNRELSKTRDLLLGGTSFLLTSHARPDGDSLGSQLALSNALKQLGKDVRIINKDSAPTLYGFLPDLSTIEVAPSVKASCDAVVVLECGRLSRTEVAGLEAQTIINIDHHLGNTMYGTVNWTDESACACAELVFDLIVALGAHLTPSMATSLYVGILTDTGSFRHANITARTFDICRQIAETGINLTDVAASIYTNGSLGHLRLSGRVLDRIQIECNGKIAVLVVNDKILAETECDPDDMEGIVNLPLASRHILVVILARETNGSLRVSLRSKKRIDVRSVALSFGGGGHLNAAGLTIKHPTQNTLDELISRVAATISDTDK